MSCVHGAVCWVIASKGSRVQTDGCNRSQVVPCKAADCCNESRIRLRASEISVSIGNLVGEHQKSRRA
eukprot:821334-Prorocentrum_minimum.AAC.1